MQAPPISHPTREYADAVSSLKPLSEQGDGVKSFIGVAMNILTGQQRILLVDEPEAFLHPGQARSFGTWIARQALEHGQQVILATHDRDIVIGLLAEPSALTLARLTRVEEIAYLNVLDPSAVASLWDNPVLRYSSVLQGLFHRTAVICEADADCRWYAAVLDGLTESGGANVAPHDVIFVPSGGKERISDLARPLADIGVRTYVVADFDAIRDRDCLRRIVAGVGGSWEPIEDLQRRVSSALESSNRWQEAKRAGLAGVPAGDANRDAADLLEALARERVLVVPVGELEGFERGYGGHGTAWLTNVLADGRHLSNESARSLVAQIG